MADSGPEPARPREALPVCAVGRNGVRFPLAVLGFYGNGQSDALRVAERLMHTRDNRGSSRRVWISDPLDKPKYSIEISDQSQSVRLGADTTAALARLFKVLDRLQPKYQLIGFYPNNEKDSSDAQKLRRTVVAALRSLPQDPNNPFALDENGLLIYNPHLSPFGIVFAESSQGPYHGSPVISDRGPRSRTTSSRGRSRTRFSSTARSGTAGMPNLTPEPGVTLTSTLDETTDVPEAEPNVTSNEIIQSVVDQITRLADPLGRIALGDELAKSLMPAVYDQMMSDAAAFRAAGGTWVQIGERLGVTPAAAQQRLDPGARARNAEKARLRRGSTAH